MEYIQKKLQSMKMGEDWAYGHDFVVKKTSTGYIIYKSGLLISKPLSIEEVAREVKLTFIAKEVNDKFLGEIQGEKEDVDHE